MQTPHVNTKTIGEAYYRLSQEADTTQLRKVPEEESTEYVRLAYSLLSRWNDRFRWKEFEDQPKNPIPTQSSPDHDSALGIRAVSLMRLTQMTLPPGVQKPDCRTG